MATNYKYEVITKLFCHDITSQITFMQYDIKYIHLESGIPFVKNKHFKIT